MIRLRHISIAFLVALAVFPVALFAQTDGDGTAQAGGGGADAANQPTPASSAYQYQSEGIFGCGPQAGAALSVGASAAIGSTYVPVNDASVTQNTYALLYKECVLRPLVDKMRQSAMTAYLKRSQVAISEGREGEPRYVVNQGDELLDVSDKEFTHFVEGGTLNALNPAIRSRVTQGLITNYGQVTRRPEDNLRCPYTGDLNAVLKGRSTDVWGGLTALQYPQCNPLGAYYIAQGQAGSRIAQAQEYQINQWNWGRGFYDVYSEDPSALGRRTYTPASVVQESYQQIIGSPVRQFESANDIGQMIGALYGGLTTQILSSNQGLYGLTQRVGTQPSYIDQVAAEASAGLRNTAVGAALQILASARQVENSYLQTIAGIVNTLSQTAAQLRAGEVICWERVVPQAQSYASENGMSLNVSTSTAFSQGVIDSQISSLALSASNNGKAAQAALTKIDQLIASLTNTASLDAQRIALQQLDTLVAQKALHTQYDVINIQKTFTDMEAAMPALVQNTLKAWAESPDPSLGWCNINNPAVPQMWANQWK